MKRFRFIGIGVVLAISLTLSVSCGGGGGGENQTEGGGGEQVDEYMSTDYDFTPEDDYGLGGGGRVDWPNNCEWGSILDEIIVSQEFLRKRVRVGDYHLGVDLSASPLEDILAPKRCRVVFSTFRPGSTNWGGVIVLQFDNEYLIVGHIDEATRPKVGATFEKGQVVAKVEKRGVHSWGLHIHVQGGHGTFSLPRYWASPPGYSFNPKETQYIDMIKFMVSNCNTSDDNGGGGQQTTLVCPYDIKVSNPSYHRVWISWVKPPLSVKTAVFWGTSQDVTTSSNRLIDSNTSEYAHDGVVPGYTYYYRLASIDSSGRMSQLSTVYNVYVSK